MKETIVKINKTKSWLFEKINKIHWERSEKTQSIKLEIKEEQLQQTMQKYKRS